MSDTRGAQIHFFTKFLPPQGHTRGWKGMRPHQLHLLGGTTCNSLGGKSLDRHLPSVFTQQGLKQHPGKANKPGLGWPVTASRRSWESSWDSSWVRKSRSQDKSRHPRARGHSWSAEQRENRARAAPEALRGLSELSAGLKQLLPRRQQPGDGQTVPFPAKNFPKTRLFGANAKWLHHGNPARGW